MTEEENAAFSKRRRRKNWRLHAKDNAYKINRALELAEAGLAYDQIAERLGVAVGMLVDWIGAPSGQRSCREAMSDDV
jgi:transposase